MANITYRINSDPVIPGTSIVKGVPLTNVEVDANFRAIDIEVDQLSSSTVRLTGDQTIGGNKTFSQPPRWGHGGSRGISLGPGTDLNTITDAGWYEALGAANTPVEAPHGEIHLTVSRGHSELWVLQTAASLHSDRIWFRRSMNAGGTAVWQPWVEMLHRGNGAALSGDQTIAGIKTFTSPIVGSTNSQVSLTGDQTIAGIKTFSSPPVVPNASFSLAQLQNIPTATILGRVSAGTGPSEPLTGAQVASTMTNAIGQLAGMRNKIINGKMEVAQRGTTVSLTTSGQLSLDRWIHTWDGSGATRAVFRQAFPPGTGPEGAPFFLSYAQSVAGSGGTFVNLEQRIEGVDTLAGQQATLSFYARNNAGTPLPSIRLVQFFGTGGSTTVTTVVASNVATTGSFSRYTYTFTVPSIVGGTVAGGNDFLAVSILLPINSVYTFDVTGVQLEPGTVATPFEHRSFGAELALCQRYYEAGTVFAVSYASSGSFVQRVQYPYKVNKRASPTHTMSVASGSLTSPAVVGGTSTVNVNIGYASTGAGIEGAFNLTAAAEL